jgi:hypothetical protein
MTKRHAFGPVAGQAVEIWRLGDALDHNLVGVEPLAGISASMPNDPPRDMRQMQRPQPQRLLILDWPV